MKFFIFPSRACRYAAVSRYLGGDEAYATYVPVAVFLAEAEALREVRANHVAVQHRDAAAVLKQLDGEYLCGRRLARARQPREPDAEALLVARRVCLGEYRRDFGAREPVRELSAAL